MNRFSRNRPTESTGATKRSVSVGRTSMAPGPSRMRSATSISGVGHVRHSSGGMPSNKPLTDSRNLSDKSVKQLCGREIHHFLMQNQYPNQIQVKDLIQGPSSTDFWKVFEFLYRIVDEDFRFEPTDDKPQIFLDSIRTIGYPFNISNSHLKTIGSPHSWPYLLGVLHWMLRPIQAMFDLDAETVLVTEDANQLHQLRWKFIGETYDAFMDGEDDMSSFVERHEDHLKQLIHGPNGGASNLKAELEHLNKKKDVMESEGDPVAEIQKHLDMVEENKCKMQKFMTDKKAYAEKLFTIVATLDAESATLKKQTAQMAEDRKCLQVVYDAQDMTPADLQKINLERGELRQKNKEASKRKEELNEMLGAKQMEIAKIRGETEKIISDFNARVRECRMVPETNENSFGFDLSLSTSTATPEIVGRLKDAMTHVHKALQDRSNNLEVEMLELKQKLEEWEDRLKASHQEHSSKERRLESLDSEYEQRKGDNNSDIESARRHTEDTIKETAELRARLAAFNTTEDEIKETCRKENVKFEHAKKKHSKELDDALGALTRLCHMAIEHKEAVTQRKKDALEGKRTHVERLEKSQDEFEEWRKGFREKMARAKEEMKKHRDESIAAADAAIKEYERFQEECEEESKCDSHVGASENDAMDIDE